MLEVLLFFVGIHFMMVLLACIYRIVDLWYCIGDHLAGILGRFSIVFALNAVLLLMLEDDSLAAFLWGQASYLAFHIIAFWLARLGLLVVDWVRR